MKNLMTMTDNQTMWEYNLIIYRMLLGGYENEIIEQIESNNFWIKKYEILQIEIDKIWVTIIDSNSRYRITLTKDDFIDFLNLSEPNSFKETTDETDVESWLQFHKDFLEIFSNKLRVTSVLQNK